MNDSITKLDSFLSFKLDQEIFAINVERVLEILEMKQITKVPKSPDYLCGVINLRGNVLPVIDTRIKFGLSATEFTVNTCIVVLHISFENEFLTIGALVDSVQEVLDIKDDQFQIPPTIGLKYRAEFISGMYKIDEQFIMLLDIDKVFSPDEIVEVKESKESA
jgi:purine-binding chemotaxis protein CheW